jgi:hypothetical protein
MPATPEFKPSEHQRRVQKILQDMTGLGVRIQPFATPVDSEARGAQSVYYLFKVDQTMRDENAKVKELHEMHDYVKRLVFQDTNATHNEISVVIIADPDDLKNAYYPCVGVKFSNVMGVPFSPQLEVEGAESLQRRQQQHVFHAHRKGLKNYQQELRQETTFRDAYTAHLQR